MYEQNGTWQVEDGEIVFNTTSDPIYGIASVGNMKIDYGDMTLENSGHIYHKSD